MKGGEGIVNNLTRILSFFICKCTDDDAYFQLWGLSEMIHL